MNSLTFQDDRCETWYRYGIPMLTNSLATQNEFVKVC